ncbi:uncharacterized protein LY89DRAFT_624895 [Mollisia scopiformis]|uniref:Protein transport protein sec16 n=1 Tax=Mollisia scopiformis TaxID=149040 RepID=A0A194WV39_MOLSC|nr:uncharacterized protein LY89DRAFT_624895 [Mollisia scopiformis]KUJ11534.1 hypothetical protein LY89DRAFT_624895 [Mollisia scopiformis]
MPSESSSPWHPAFMPNSEADLIATKKSAESTHASSQPEPTPESPKAEPVTSPLTVDTEHGLEEQVEEIEHNGADNDGHPELSNLRDALATSLASPGGVELEESPLHNEVQPPEPEEQERADFPSEEPSNESKHLSTMSFTRTVSHEVNWGEDDEVDPEWNLHRTDTDPFKFMAKSDRTNSFPAVPPAHSAFSHPEEQLSHSQAEEIMNEVEHEGKDLFSDHGDNDEADFFNGTSGQQHTGEEFLHDAEDGGASTFAPAYGGDIRREEDEEEARFEEGLPLVQHTDHPETGQEAPNTNHGAFEDDANEDHDFFAHVSKEEDTQPEPHLERKSTMQVMDSLDFQPHYQAHEDTIEEENETMQSSQSSLDRSIGGGIGVSTSTVLSQVLGDPNAPIHNQPEILAALESDSGEGDLAAKWKAALACDEFLDDDDELLPDEDEAVENGGENKTIDPSDLFGSDDEGFLEDTEDQSGSDPFPQQISPPIPAPVTSPNGHVVGFDSLTGAVHGSRPGSSGTSSSRYLPAGAVASAPKPANTYAPAAPLLTDFSRPATTTSVPSPYMAPPVSSFPPQQQRPELPKAQSFADKSKGGYASPYDLPMEVVKPRKRISMQQMNRQPSPANAPAPPRSSSMFTQPPPPPRSASASMSPPTSSHGVPQNQPRPSATPTLPQPPTLVKQSSSGFFEELPMAHRPKPAPRHPGSFGSPAQSTFIHPVAAPPPPMAPPPAPRGSYAAPPLQQPVQQPSSQTLVAPERVSPYAALPTATGPPPATATRYSPSPSQPTLQAAIPPPAAQSRYSPAPPNPRQHTPSYSSPANAPPPVLAHQPRTSSPLAHFERNQDPRHGFHSETAGYDRRSSSSGYESNLRHQHLPPTREVDENEQAVVNGNRKYGDLQNQNIPQPRSVAQTPPPPPQNLASRLVSSPPKRIASNYQPQQPATGPPQTFAPPKRSQTQSPGSGFGVVRRDISPIDPYQRPASVEGPTSPRAVSGYSAPSVTSSYSRKRGFSQGYNYIAPTDGREHDPLQRWKGAPVFAWGVGGTIMTSFPKDVPRYGIGQTAPMVVRSPGEVKLRNIKDVDPLPERLSTFPGPLKSKAKKKEVMSWLTSGIAILEQSASYLRTTSHLSHEDKRIEERILLWKILRVFIENDGLLEGSPPVEKAVRAVLSPGLDDKGSSTTPLYATGAELSGISASSAPKADAVDPSAVDELRKHLLRGEREKAVWEAVDKRLWAHAMLISNTVSKDLYKRVAQEFVQKEVKNIGDNTQPLAALYEIFAGNFEESVDELVPPSARAGYQLVSTSNAAGPSKDALEGLDRWRETLGLVLSNRSPDDNQALNALGKLLSGYGRAEAAHICFLFARSLSIFGGVDDPQASIVLVGSDQLRQPYDFDREMEPILLSEVFEYGMSLANPAAIAASTPHLAVYKLQHAKILAENGFRDKALQYCESIATAISSQTRRSPYHHNLLVAELDDLSKRLKSSPKDETSSWISKPSIDKAKGSVWATFNKFVAGDDNDTPATVSSAGSANDVGPFARIAGGTPTISRSPSNSDIYSSYNNGLAIPGSATKTNSRYAPGGSYGASTHEPLSSSYGSQPRTSLEERSSNEFRRYEPQRQMSDYRPASQASNSINNYSPQTSSTYTPQNSSTPYGNNGSPYEPTSAYAPPQTPVTNPATNNFYSSPQPLNNSNTHQPPYESSQPPPSFEQPTNNYQSFSNSYEPSAGNSYEPSTSSGYEASGGYEPPSSSYEPPAYVPTTMDDEPDSPVDTRPQKKSFMDDDDDDIPGLKQQPVGGEKTKAEKDREADEAFRKAAEADAQKAKESAPAKKGWGLGGWFGGSKKEADMGAQPNKPIRAKLGEASSFVYDPELKRWVNKKGGAEATETKSATPPPPRAGPPRTASMPPSTSAPRPMSMGSVPPPMAQRAVSESVPGPSQSDGQSEASHPTLAPPSMARSASNGSIGLNGGPPSSGPPSRPGTGMSNASSIDDLLGPAMPRKGAAVKKAAKKKGRGYVDVMGEK